MSDFQIVGGIKKLNNNNYNTWATCIMSSLQEHGLWEIVGRNEITPLEEDSNSALRKWRVKVDKAMFALKTTIKKEML